MGPAATHVERVPSFLECDLLHCHILACFLSDRGMSYHFIDVNPVRDSQFVSQDRERAEGDMSTKSVYVTIWDICKLKRKFFPWFDFSTTDPPLCRYPIAHHYASIRQDWVPSK